MPLNHFRSVRSIRSDLFLAARAWIYFEPEPPFSLLLVLCLGDINATPRGLNLSMTSSIPVNTRGQSDRNGYALTTPLQALSHFNALNGITFSLKGKRTFKSKLTFV